MAFKFKHGEHKGKWVEEVPTPYLEYIRNQAAESLPAVEAELRSRKLAEGALPFWIEEIVNAGTTSLLKAHEADAKALSGVHAAFEYLQKHVSKINGSNQ